MAADAIACIQTDFSRSEMLREGDSESDEGIKYRVVGSATTDRRGLNRA